MNSQNALLKAAIHGTARSTSFSVGAVFHQDRFSLKRAITVATAATVIAMAFWAGEQTSNKDLSERIHQRIVSGSINAPAPKIETLQDIAEHKPAELQSLHEYLQEKWKLNEQDASWLIDAAVEHGKRTNQDGFLLLSVALQETGGKHTKSNGEVRKSPVGATGIMQVMPKVHKKAIKEVAQELGKPKDDRDVIMWVGSDILKEYARRSQDIPEALKRYNGSLNHPYGDTYVNGVKSKLTELKSVTAPEIFASNNIEL